MSTVNNRPGWQTTEFWLSVVGVLATLSVVSGTLTPADSDKAANALVQLVMAIGNAIQVFIYIRSRVVLKESAAQVQVASLNAAAAAATAVTAAVAPQQPVPVMCARCGQSITSEAQLCTTSAAPTSISQSPPQVTSSATR